MKITIKAAMALRDKSRVDVAKYMGVSLPTVDVWIKDYTKMSLSNFSKLCAFLKIDPSDLTKEVENG